MADLGALVPALGTTLFYWKIFSWCPRSYHGHSLHCVALPRTVWLHCLCNCPSNSDGHLHLLPTSQRAEPKTIPQDSTEHVLSVAGPAQSDTASNTHGLQIFPVSTGDSVLNSFPKGMEKRQKRYEDGWHNWKGLPKNQLNKLQFSCRKVTARGEYGKDF